MSDLNLAMLDADGAIRDAAESAGLDRGDFLKKGALAGGGLLVGSAMFSGILSSAEAAISTTKRSASNDVKILNYALTLEFLEAAFYEQAVANDAFGSNAALKQFAEVVAIHERKHVNFLKGALGSKAIKSPKFDFGNAVTDTGDVRRDGPGTRGHGRQRLPRPGRQHCREGHPRGRRHDRDRRGAPRRLDSQHQRRASALR